MGYGYPDRNHLLNNVNSIDVVYLVTHIYTQKVKIHSDQSSRSKPAQHIKENVEVVNPAGITGPLLEYDELSEITTYHQD